MYILFRSQRYFLHDSRLKINVSKSRFHHRYIWSKVFTGSSLVGGCCFLSGLRLAPSYKFNYPPSFLSPSSLLPLSGNSKSITCIYIDIHRYRYRAALERRAEARDKIDRSRFIGLRLL